MFFSRCLVCAGTDLRALVNNKVAIVTKTLVKSISLGVQLQQLKLLTMDLSNSGCINNYADYPNG